MMERSLNTFNLLFMKKSYCLILLVFIISTVSKAQDLISKSIVRIYSTKQSYDYNEPWKMQKVLNTSATGFVVEGNRILTNAHAVSNSKFINISFEDNPEKIEAVVEFISDDYDLAILKLSNDSILSKIIPIDFGSMPKLQDKVTVYGYPMGGDRLSITEGIVSRIQTIPYALSKKKHTVIQTDAAINPGNSGGPALYKGKIIGVAFQGISRANNIGYLIPSHIVKAFLNDVKDNEYDGIPSLGIKWLPLESKIHQKMLGVIDNETGILINSVLDNSISDGILKKNDVLLTIDNFNIAFDGSIKYRNDERVEYTYILENKSFGENVEITFLRNKEKKSTKITLNKLKIEKNIIESYRSFKPPTYYILSGFIFEKLSLNYLNQYTESPLNTKDAPHNMINLIENPLPDVDEIVIIVSVLNDQSNVGYENLKNIIVRKVNNEVIRSMKDFISKVKHAEYIVIEDLDCKEIVLDKKLSDSRENLIKETYGITNSYSKNLEPYLMK